jgi:hypothetical protein
MGQIPRIARWRPRQIKGRSTMRKFMRGELAHENGASLVQLGGCGRVPVWQALLTHAGMP